MEKEIKYKLLKLNGDEINAVRIWINQPGDQGRSVCVKGLSCKLCSKIFPGRDKCPRQTYDYQFIMDVAIKLMNYNNVTLEHNAGACTER